MAQFFINIPVPVSFQKQLDAAREIVPGDIHYKFEAYPHVTVRFIQELTDQQFTDLDLKLREIAQGIEPFTIYLNGNTDLFGPDKDYLVARAESARLNQLHELVDDACLDVGADKEKWKTYKPHVSLGKGPEVADTDFKALKKLLLGNFVTDQFHFTSSDPSTGEYKPERVYLLGSAGERKMTAHLQIRTAMEKLSIDDTQVHTYWDYVDNELKAFYPKAKAYARKGVAKVGRANGVLKKEDIWWELSHSPVGSPLNAAIWAWVQTDFLPWVFKQAKPGFWAALKRREGTKAKALVSNLIRPKKTTLLRDLQPFVGFSMVNTPKPTVGLLRDLADIVL